MNTRTRTIWALVAVVVVATGLTLALIADGNGAIDLPFDLSDVSDTSTSEPGAAEIERLAKLPSGPVPPANVFADGAKTEDADYQAYVAETAEDVTKGADEIVALGKSMLQAYMDDDASALAALFAEDENVSSGDARALLDRYPEILDGEPAANVNVYALQSATLYMYSLNVVWTDAGVTSTHVLDVPMRLVDNEWLVSQLGPGLLDSRFIQSVMLR